MLSGSVNSQDHPPRQTFRLPRRRGFERLRMGAEPSLHHAIAAQTLVDSPRYGFYLG
jgi:hypothetical protein